MHKLLIYYNQNRIKIWTTIMAIIFIIAILQILNNFQKEEIHNTNNIEKTSNVISYSKEGESIITAGEVPEVYQNKFGAVINEFYTYCIENKFDMAYELLAPDIKRELYPSQKQFEELYCKERFEGNKDFSFQSWTTSNNTQTYIYQVKIFDNMLTSGKKNDEYIEDYVTVVPEGDTYKLNINSYIGRKTINKESRNEEITIETTVCDNYMDYKIYTFRIKNNTNETLILDTRKSTDTIYATDEKSNKYKTFLYENEERDLILEPQEAKVIKIKFNISYRTDLKIKDINFTDITDYNENIHQSLIINL